MNMKQCNKVFLFIMTAVMCLLLTGTSTTVSAASNDEVSLTCYSVGYTHFVGETYKLNYYISDGTDYKATDFSYKTSNSKVATVSKDGKVTGVSYGDVTITMTCKSNTKLKASCKIHFYQTGLTIQCSSNTFKAGKTYQLKSNQKNVIWSIYNMYGNSADASIDSNSGKLKIRNAGEVFIYARTADGKYYGSTYITATGPIISDKISFDPIVIDEDMEITDYLSLEATGLLPETVTLNYTNGKKSGTVECTLNWSDYNDLYDYSQPGSYELYYSITAPEGYAFGNIEREQLQLEIKEEQTDNRIHIVKFEEVKVTLKKDYHVCSAYDIVGNYLTNTDTKLIGITEDGKKVEFEIWGTSSPGSFNSFCKTGTYNEVRLCAKDKLGYVIDDDVYAALTVTVKKKQTYQGVDDTTLTLDDIPGELEVMLPSTQEGIN